MLPGVLIPWGRKKPQTQKTGVIDIQAHLAWSLVSGTGQSGKLLPSVGLSIIPCNLISPGFSYYGAQGISISCPSSPEICAFMGPEPSPSVPFLL